MPKFSCSHCGQHLIADDAYAGMDVLCSNCNKEVVVPRMVAPPPPIQSASPLNMQSGKLPLQLNRPTIANQPTYAAHKNKKNGILGGLLKGFAALIALILIAAVATNTQETNRSDTVSNQDIRNAPNAEQRPIQDIEQQLTQDIEQQLTQDIEQQLTQDIEQQLTQDIEPKPSHDIEKNSTKVYKVKGFYIGMDIQDVPGLLKDNMKGTKWEIPGGGMYKVESENGKKVVKVGGFGFVFAQASEDGRVEEIFIPGLLADDLFKTHDMPANEFVEKFINSYGIPEMRVDERNVWYYIDPSGIKIKIDNTKGVLLEKVASERERAFN
jgi:hypothetical protein